jgi:HEAT repeat protein
MTTEKQAIINTELGSGNNDRITEALSALNLILRAMEADESSVQPLTVLLENEDLEIRRSASWSIAKLAQNKAVHSCPLDKIILLLQDPDEEIRENMAWSLGELAGVGVGSTESIEPLNRSLEDVDVQVRGMAAWALGRLAERMLLARPSSIVKLEKLLLDKSLFVSKGAAYSLERVTKTLNQYSAGRPES